ncbi:MAG TPA: Na+/H+ antiporter NhaC family protein [Gemmatimonadota bacterium]|nr:Na+/H+ antiporter NhaC family protein [Gemmatimonadota bacterium]
MTETHGLLSLAPPLLAIALAIATRQVYLSLILGIWSGWWILAGWNPLAGARDALEAIAGVIANVDNAKILLFSLAIGAVLTLTQRSGGVEGFVAWLQRLGIGHSRRSAGYLAAGIGTVVFIESNITSLVTGTVARPLFDRLRISRAKLAYICDSTAAPVCVLVGMNAWGAYVIGLLGTQGVEDPVAAFVRAIPYNFYSILALALVWLVVTFDWNLGPMREEERQTAEEGPHAAGGPSLPEEQDSLLDVPPKPGAPARALNMILPVVVLVGMMVVGLFVTGEGDPLDGDGSTSVLWAISSAIAAMFVLYKVQGIMGVEESSKYTLQGMAGLLPLVVVLVLAFALGATCNALGTGPFVASVVERFLSPGLVPALLFLAGGLISFSTGTSWGTFAIMIPIGVPMVDPLGLSLPLVLGAVLSGGIFGDHCSPISDTTIVASLASACDHITHVRTQLPYALLAGGAATALFLAAGMATAG